MSSKENPCQMQACSSRGPGWPGDADVRGGTNLRVGSRDFFGAAFREADELVGDIRILAGTDREYQRRIAVLGRVCVLHRAVQIDPLSCSHGHGRVELQVHLDRSLEHIDEFLSLVPRRLTKLNNIVRLDAADDRDHPLLSKIRTQVLIVVVRGRYTDGVAAGGQTSARREDRALCIGGRRITHRQEFGHAHPDSRGELLYAEPQPYYDHSRCPRSRSAVAPPNAAKATKRPPDSCSRHAKYSWTKGTRTFPCAMSPPAPACI